MAIPCPSGRRALGGGTPKQIVVHVGTKRVRREVTVRLGLWGVPSIGIITGSECAGQLVVFNHDVQRWQIVASVFHAIRQTWHILFQYGKDIGYGEKRRMARAAALARELNLTVLGYGRPHADIAELRTRTRGAIREASQLIGTPRKPSKQEAAAQLASLSMGEDRHGRVNPGATMARTVVTREQLLRRLEREILHIDPQIVRRQHALIQLVHYAEQIILYGVRHFLDNVCSKTGIAQLSEPTVRRQVAQHCRYLASDLERLDFAPYREACSETAQDLRSAGELLGSDDRLDDARCDEVMQLFRACNAAMTLKAVQLVIERQLYVLMRESGRTGFQPRTVYMSLIVARVLLSEVDESMLRLPVRAAVEPHLEAAMSALEYGKTQESFADAKNALKAASAAL